MVASRHILLVVSAFGLIGTAAAQPTPLPPAPAGVQVTHDQGFEFVTVYDPSATGYPVSTADWTGTAQDYQGRGATTEAFRISRTEVSTGQWLEFVNTFSNRAMPQDVRDRMFTAVTETFFGGPMWWGAQAGAGSSHDQTTTWSLRQDVAQAANLPVYGIGWRSAAMYCNWLHNDRASDWSALLGGAYDTTTWGWRENGTFADALTHEAGARYWIPTLDQWVMSVHWDPNRFGPGQGGFWERVNGSDAAPMPGWPADPLATTSAGIPIDRSDVSGILEIPIGSYPASQSPWGLLDTSGGVVELTEEAYSQSFPGQFNYRRALGASSGLVIPGFDPLLNNTFFTRIFSGESNSLNSGDYEGLRIAAAVPVPAAGTPILLFICTLSARWSRR